jgi:hypothetical protein
MGTHFGDTVVVLSLATCVEWIECKCQLYTPDFRAGRSAQENQSEKTQVRQLML